MKQRFSLAIAAALAASGFSMVTTPAWAEDTVDKVGTAAKDVADKAGDVVDNTAESAGNAAKGAADKAADVAGRVTGKSGDKAASDTASVGEKPALPAGVKAKEGSADEDRAGVLKTIHTATQAALTKDGFDDLVERLVDEDRNRLGKDGATEKKFDDLNAKVDGFQKAWKAKYGSDFKAGEADTLASVMTSVGEVEDPAALASAWPVAQTAQATGGDAVTASAKESEGKSQPNLDSNIEKGRDVAVAALPASHGMPGLNVSLIQEAGGYRIDVPNTLTAQQLHDNLLKHMTNVMDMQSKWPADEQEARAAAAHLVLLSVYGIDAQKSDAQKDSARDAGSSDASRDASRNAATGATGTESKASDTVGADK